MLKEERRNGRITLAFFDQLTDSKLDFLFYASWISQGAELLLQLLCLKAGFSFTISIASGVVDVSTPFPFPF